MEENQLPHYTVEFRNFTTQVKLGEEHNFTIHIKRGKCCQPWAYIKTPTVDLKHVKSHTCNVADVSITSADQLDFISLLQPETLESMDDEEKWELTNTWIVTYTPYCGGLHTFTVNVGDESTEHDLGLVAVYGVPRVGAQVMRGPHGYGAIEGEVVSYDESLEKITVKASMWNGFRYRYGGHALNKATWGRNERYEIQLKH